jgi:hypothetical protein
MMVDLITLEVLLLVLFKKVMQLQLNLPGVSEAMIVNCSR